MSFAEIEAELEKLSPDELRRLSLKSWTVFVAKEGGSDTANECSEDDSRLLAAWTRPLAKRTPLQARGIRETKFARD